VECKIRFYRKHIEPALGQLRLDEIDDQQVARLKGRMAGRAPKTVNNTLSILGKALKVAVSWKVIPGLPCTIRLLKTAKPVVEFYEATEYERLLAAAAKCDGRTRIIVLLGGDAGLRLGEILGLEWPDLDLARGLLKVQRAVWEGEVTLPKGGRPRVIPMTARLKTALQEHRHLKGDRVLYTDEGVPAAKAWVKWLLDVAERRGGLRRGGRVHILRHTFCSRLAMRNVPMLTIKELAGHVSLETTQRYMLGRGAAGGDQGAGAWRRAGDGPAGREGAEWRRVVKL
jgi:integrase